MFYFNKSTVVVCSLILAAWMLPAAGFELVGTQRIYPIIVAEGEPECVRLAAEDMSSDVKKITGHKPPVAVRGSVPPGGCVLIGSVSNPTAVEMFKRVSLPVSSIAGEWEAYKVTSHKGNFLTIAGSDERGTMFGLYAFAEKYLHVDPLWFWSGIEPEKKALLNGIPLS